MAQLLSKCVRNPILALPFLILWLKKEICDSIGDFPYLQGGNWVFQDAKDVGKGVGTDVGTGVGNLRIPYTIRDEMLVTHPARISSSSKNGVGTLCRNFVSELCVGTGCRNRVSEHCVGMLG